MTLHRRELRPSAYNPPIHPMTEDDWSYWQKRNGKAPRRSILSRIFGGRRG